MFPIAWIPQGQELIIIGIIVIVLFGAKKLPEIGKSLAEGIHEFKKASKEVRKEDAEEAKPKTDDPED